LCEKTPRAVKSTVWGKGAQTEEKVRMTKKVGGGEEVDRRLGLSNSKQLARQSKTPKNVENRFRKPGR